MGKCSLLERSTKTRSWSALNMLLSEPPITLTSSSVIGDFGGVGELTKFAISPDLNDEVFTRLVLLSCFSSPSSTDFLVGVTCLVLVGETRGDGQFVFCKRSKRFCTLCPHCVANKVACYVTWLRHVCNCLLQQRIVLERKTTPKLTCGEASISFASATMLPLFLILGAIASSTTRRLSRRM